jgi:predicted ABC-type ATPase
MKQIVILGGPNGAGKTTAAQVILPTSSGKGHVRFLRRSMANGWGISLAFLWLPSPQRAVERVARRVTLGGHHIPPETIIRRYWAGLRNMLTDYLPLADIAAIYDDSTAQPHLVAERKPGAELQVHDAERWERIGKLRHEGHDLAADE